jgi:hypothetical protein
LEEIEKLLDKLDEDDDVQAVYTNIAWQKFQIAKIKYQINPFSNVRIFFFRHWILFVRMTPIEDFDSCLLKPSSLHTEETGLSKK